MTAKKRTQKKRTNLKTTVRKRRKPAKGTVQKAAPRTRSGTKPSLKGAAAKTKTRGKKTAVAKSARVPKKRAPRKSQNFGAEVFARQELRQESAGQAGDLQGLSNVEAADSESVGELLEEGNAFEADVVAGVESAGDTEGKEVRTHEVPEDDVPGEYLDKE